MKRYFLGRFKKDPNLVDLTELKKSFVIFEQDEEDNDVTAVFSNTDVQEGEQWNYAVEKQPAKPKYLAASKKRR